MGNCGYYAVVIVVSIIYAPARFRFTAGVEVKERVWLVPCTLLPHYSYNILHHRVNLDY